MASSFRSTSKETVIRAKSPLRISFAGGGTDLPHYFEKHGGAVLSSSINRYAYATLYPRQDREVRIRSLSLGYLVKYNLEDGPPYDGVLDLAKAAIHRMGVGCGIDMDIRSDAPPGSGLGGSSALTAAVLGALTNLTERSFNPYELAELNYSVERIDLKIAGGKQDQYATTFGGFNLLEFQRDRVAVRPIQISRDILNDLEAHLLLCYTGKVRPKMGLVEKQIQLYHEGRSETLAGMNRLHEMAYAMKEVLLRGQVDQFGEMLGEAYENKKRMNPYIVEGTLADQMYQAALQHGAIGGKLCGAGGGGYLLLYYKTDRQQELVNTLEELGGQFTHFTFVDRGLQTWRSSSR